MPYVVKQRIRTCIGCGERSDKRELYRVVRSSDGSVSFDSTGRAAGRGAYVCSSACFGRALSKGALKRALKCNVSTEQTAEIAAELERAVEGAQVV